MKTLHRRCAGLDVHSDSVVACARLTVRTKASHEVRRFSTATRDLLELADWLAAQGVTHVAMEATGIYWKAIWHILEGRFELVLANAAHIRNVPDRKSDVNDAVWISDLLAARPDTCELRAAGPDSGCARSNADENAVGTRGRPTYSAYSKNA
jgi:transposase